MDYFVNHYKTICMKDNLLTFFTFIDYISTGFKYLVTAVFVFNNYPSMYYLQIGCFYPRLFPPRNIHIAKEKINI